MALTVYLRISGRIGNRFNDFLVSLFTVLFQNTGLPQQLLLQVLQMVKTKVQLLVPCYIHMWNAVQWIPNLFNNNPSRCSMSTLIMDKKLLHLVHSSHHFSVECLIILPPARLKCIVALAKSLSQGNSLGFWLYYSNAQTLSYCSNVQLHMPSNSKMTDKGIHTYLTGVNK